jgi:hypothetical protein
MNEVISNIIQFTGLGFSKVLPNLPWRIYRFLQIYHPTLILLAIAGIALGWKKKIFNKKGELFILSFLVFHLVTIAGVGTGSRRYALSLVPLTIFWAGKGLCEIWQRWKGHTYGSKFLYPALIILIIGSQLPMALNPIRSHREEQKIIGLWLRENSPKHSFVASINPQEAFYADRKWIQIPREKKSYAELLSFLIANRVNYLVVDRAMREAVPDFFESVDQNDLKEILRVHKKGESEALIFKVQ